MEIPKTRFARSGDVHVANQVFGDGPIDLLVCGSWQSNVEGRWAWTSARASTPASVS